jgi:hypothetical protein
MRKADNFNASKWLVENKITFQSRLNELLDTDKVKQLGKKAVEDYILKNNLDSIDDIKYTGGGTFSDKANAVFYSTSSTGEITKYTVQYDANYNLVDIKTDVIKPTNDVFKPTKIKGIKANVDGDYVTFLSRSGEYDGNIENDGTIRLEIFYPDMEEGEEEIDNDNWKNILGPNHMFVKIANSIPTEVDTEGDAVAITFKASDLISMNESKLNENEDLTSQIAALPDFETSPDTEEATLIVGNYAVVHYDQTDEGGEDMYVVWDNTRDQEEIGSYDDEPEFESADPAEVAAFLKSKNNNVDESYYATLGGSSPLSDVAMKTKIVEPVLGPNFETVKMFKDSSSNPRYKQLEAKFPREIIDKWKLLYRSDSYQGYAKLSPDGKVIKATILDDGGVSGVFYVKSGDGIK